MLRVPLSLSTLALACALAACGGEERHSLTAGLPFSDRPIPTGETILAAGDDTLRLTATPLDRERRIRLARYRSVAGEIDSLIAVVDQTTKAPLRSFYRVRRHDGGTATASVAYGEGFEGQARLVLTSGGRVDENLRTPSPALDLAQVPLTLTALDFTSPDSLSVNTIAPFERRAVPSRLVIGSRTSLRLPEGAVETVSVRFVVAGLEEQYWFEIDPPHRLVRLREITRGTTWTRVDARP